MKIEKKEKKKPEKMIAKGKGKLPEKFGKMATEDKAAKISDMMKKA